VFFRINAFSVQFFLFLINNFLLLVKRWSNFIHDNDPNSDLTKEQFQWPKFSFPNVMPEINELNHNFNDSLNYMAFRSVNKINKATNLDSCYLWNNLIPANLEVLGKKISLCCSLTVKGLSN
jgi:hypothetical protein